MPDVTQRRAHARSHSYRWMLVASLTRHTQARKRGFCDLVYWTMRRARSRGLWGCGGYAASALYHTTATPRLDGRAAAVGYATGRRRALPTSPGVRAGAADRRAGYTAHAQRRWRPRHGGGAAVVVHHSRRLHPRRYSVGDVVCAGLRATRADMCHACVGHMRRVQSTAHDRADLHAARGQRAPRVCAHCARSSRRSGRRGLARALTRLVHARATRTGRGVSPRRRRRVQRTCEGHARTGSECGTTASTTCDARVSSTRWGGRGATRRLLPRDARASGTRGGGRGVTAPHA